MPMIETTDLFRSAYLLAQGSELVEVRLTRRDRARAVLLIGGAEVEHWDRLYLSGEARINPL